jgi:tetratricopeptide (TPR) repeat protein
LKKPVYISVFAFLLVLGWGCSQEKNTTMNRWFHNLTAHYNGYFWARENIKEGVDKIERSTPDDFGKLIPLFVYGDDKTAKSNKSFFDKAIEKESRVIKFHSMLIKGKEYCKWIDENYLVLGQAHFYEKEYFDAIDVFEYIVRQYPKTETRYLALLWLIRTYNAQLSVANTEATIDLLKNDKGFPKKFEGEFSALQAEYWIMMENYEKASAELKKAIPLTHNKKQKARYLYVLAQLEEMKGNTKLANNYYEQCAKLHPPYEMYFSSRIKRAMTVQEGSDASKSVKKELNKMLRDEKNLEFRDQIYYALAEISIKEKDTAKALDYLKKSALNSTVNTRQHGMSFLRAADIYFTKTEYVIAQAYYDSALSFLPKDYKDYDFITEKKNSLTGLVKNLNIIQRQDSLLKLSGMDTLKLKALVNKIISDLTVEEERKKEQDKINQQQQQQTGFQTTSGGGNTQQTVGAWYFYNASSISSGFADFAKKWGNRQLEDNWRRGNKEVVMQTNNEEQTHDSLPKKDKTIAENKKPQFYLKNIPFTEAQKQDARNQIIEAYNNVGSIYKEQLQNYDRSIDAFVTLNKRFPGNKYECQNYYQVYRLAILKKNKNLESTYKSKVLASPCDTTAFAYILAHPEEIQNREAKKHEAEIFYTQTYDTYMSGKYNDALAMINQADSIYSGSDVMPKFALLKAYCIGRTQGAKDYELALTKIIVKYPKDPAKQKAQELLDQLKHFKSGSDTSHTNVKIDSTAMLFSYDKDAEHYVMIVIPNDKQNFNDFKIRLSNFNTQYFPNANLSIYNVLLGMEYQVYTIRSFENSQKAMDYYQLIVSDGDVFRGIDPGKTVVVAITPDNYTTFYKKKKKAEYEKFFKENYLKK